MINKKLYIKITLPGSEDGYVETIEGAKEAINNMVEYYSETESDDSFEFKVIELTEEEFKGQ